MPLVFVQSEFRSRLKSLGIDSNRLQSHGIDCDLLLSIAINFKHSNFAIDLQPLDELMPSRTGCNMSQLHICCIFTILAPTFH